MADRSTFIRPPYFVDPFLPLEDEFANRLFGRITKIGQSSTNDASKVWVLIMRNMYGVLVGEELAKGNKIYKKSPKSREEVKPLQNASVKQWAKAFNIAVKTQTEAGFFHRPVRIDTDKPPDDWPIPITLRNNDKFKEKWSRYVGTEREVTNAILSKMEAFRLAVRDDFLRDPGLQLGNGNS